MTADLFIDSLFGKGYLRVPKIAIRAFGGARALFLAFLYDLSEFSKLQGNDDFFATREKASNDLGFSVRVCDNYFKFFRENGVLIGYRKGIQDSKKYYKINNERLCELLTQCGCANADSACDTERKICGQANADSACAIYNNKESIKTNSIITNSAIAKNQNENLLENAKNKFLEAKSKPKVSLELWLDFLKSKAEVLKKKRKSLTNAMIDLNFGELYKLQEIGVDLNERLNKAIAEGWQGIWFDSDSREWQKRGGHFKQNVGHLDFNQSQNADNPLSAIETHLKL